MRLGDFDALKKTFENLHLHPELIELIDNAPTVSDRYEEGYAQGYIDGSTGADWRFGE